MEMVLRQFDYWATTYRRTWRGSVVSTFVMPLFYLLGMGVGLGAFVDDQSRSELPDGVTYLEFIGPGLLATMVMMTAMFESTYPVYGNIKWTKVYEAMLATPLTVVHVLNGHLLYVAFRAASMSAVFVVVLAGFGIVDSVAGGIGALLAAILIGMAHATPVFAYSARLKSDSGFAPLFRLGLLPMFLFSGAFFPVSSLPDGIEWLAYVMPVYHGVELCRDLILGSVEWGVDILNVAYLVTWIVVGWGLARRSFGKRLAEGA
jgi:lipooligosaccharide transport system permease protein